MRAAAGAVKEKEGKLYSAGRVLGPVATGCHAAGRTRFPVERYRSVREGADILLGGAPINRWKRYASGVRGMLKIEKNSSPGSHGGAVGPRTRKSWH